MDFQAAASGAFTLNVTVPASAVGKIIGKAGSTIRDLQDRFSVKVNVPKVAPGSTSAVEVKVSGDDKSNVSAAVSEISSLAAASQAPRAPRTAERPERTPFVKSSVTVPQTAVGRIIGRGGETIRDLQASTGCRINVPSPDAADPSKVVVAVSGPTKGAVDDAVEQINSLVASAAAPRAPRPDRSDRDASAAPAAYTNTVDIESESVGRVIGKGGMIIRGLQEKYSCSIKVPKGATGPFTTVTVGGADEASVQAAIDDIVAKATAEREVLACWGCTSFVVTCAPVRNANAVLCGRVFPTRIEHSLSTPAPCPAKPVSSPVKRKRSGRLCESAHP